MAPLDGAKVGQVVSAGLSVGWHTVPDKYALLGGQALGLLLGPVLSLLGVKGNQALLSFDQAASGVTARIAPRTARAPLWQRVDRRARPGGLPSRALERRSRPRSAGAEQILGVIEAESGPVDELVLTGGWSTKRRVAATKTVAPSAKEVASSGRRWRQRGGAVRRVRGRAL